MLYLDMENLTLYKEILKNEILCGDNSLKLKFQFTHDAGGIVLIDDIRNGGIKNATFGLSIHGDNCFLRILTKDFEIILDTKPPSSTTEINQEFYLAIEFLTTRLFAFQTR